MSDELSNAEFRAALGSINYNASNYQVFTFTIAFSFLIAISVLVGSLISIGSQDQGLTSGGIITFATFDVIALVVILLTYNAYLRNVGKYVFSRVKPISFKTEDNQCTSRIKTGTTPKGASKGSTEILTQVSNFVKGQVDQLPASIPKPAAPMVAPAAAAVPAAVVAAAAPKPAAAGIAAANAAVAGLLGP